MTLRFRDQYNFREKSDKFCKKFKSNKKYVLSNSESVQRSFFIFDHVTFTQFKICCCV